MAAVCGGETEATAPVEPSSEGARRRRMEIHKFRFVAADVAVAPPLDNERKRHNNIFPASPPASESCDVSENCKKRRKLEGNDVCYVSKACEDEGFVVEGEIRAKVSSEDPTEDPDRPESATCSGTEPDCPKFGMTSVCGRRRDMEDAVAIHPFFRRNTENSTSSSHFFGVYDGHGCSHVAMKCRDRMHEIVQSEVGGEEPEWKEPDRPDEVNRIEAAGGRVIYWDGPRVLGVLAMSRAIGDNYLKPYVISEPEVTVTERTAEDECLILASDGLWDVVSNETACSVARMCLRQGKPPSPPRSPGRDDAVTAAAGESSDKACSDASILLTKLALARYSSDNISVVIVDLRRNP
nr:protein phosphatase 2C 37-like [Ipomoea batatas]